MNQQLITIVVVTASAILNFLLTQPAGTFPQNVLIVIGATSIGLTTIARFLPSAGTPLQVEVTKPVETTPAPSDESGQVHVSSVLGTLVVILVILAILWLLGVRIEINA